MAPSSCLHDIWVPRELRLTRNSVALQTDAGLPTSETSRAIWRQSLHCIEQYNLQCVSEKLRFASTSININRFWWLFGRRLLPYCLYVLSFLNLIFTLLLHVYRIYANKDIYIIRQLDSLYSDRYLRSGPLFPYILVSMPFKPASRRQVHFTNLLVGLKKHSTLENTS